jgi:hypothetical protein
MMDTSAAFVVPRDLRLPPELVGDVPRQLPPEVLEGPLAQRKRAAFWGFLAAAAVCLVVSLLPFIDTLALYFLPLGYLLWISLGLFVFALLTYLGGGHLKKAAKYVQYGHAGFGRVTELVKYPSVAMHGQPTMHAFRAIVQVPHPDSDQPVFMQVKSPDFSTHKKDQVETRCQVGDFVPVVWMPNKFDKTFQIYDFLEATHASSLQRGTKSAKTPLWHIILLAIMVPGFFFLLFWNVYALGRYMPLDFDFVRSGLWPMIAGGILGIGVALAGWLATRKKSKKIEQRNLDAVVAGKPIELTHRMGVFRKVFYTLLIGAGAILLGAGSFLCWSFTCSITLLSRRSPCESPR